MEEFKLWAHQIQAIERAREIPDLAIYHDPGLGKSLTTIMIYLERCREHDRFLKALIFTPKAVVGSWKREFHKYTDIDDSKVTVLGGGSNEKRLQLFKEKIKDDPNQIFIINYEALLNKYLHAELVKWCPEILICDESHKVKSHDALRSIRLEPIADKALHRYILTGTPLTNSEMEIFQQYRILDKGTTFGNKFHVFKNIYFEDANAGWSHQSNHFPKFVPRKFTYERLNKLIYAKAVRAKKEDCLDLPPLVKKEIEVELSPEQRRLYKEMHNEFVTFIKDELSKSPRAVVAELAMHKALRLQQIVSGFVKVEKTAEQSEKNIRVEDNPRLKALEELIEDIVPQEKIIIWAIFRENYVMIEELLEKMDIEYSMIVGGTKDAQAEIDRFQTDPTCRIMLSNQKAGGVGLNLQQASSAIYYSKGFSLDEDIQSLARCYRGGSNIHQKITRYDLIAPNTIDQLVNEALSKKQKMSDMILDLAII